MQWDEATLQRFVLGLVRQTMSALPKAITAPKITATEKLVVADQLELSPQAVSYIKTKLGL